MQCNSSIRHETLKAIYIRSSDFCFLKQKNSQNSELNLCSQEPHGKKTRKEVSVLDVANSRE